MDHQALQGCGKDKPVYNKNTKISRQNGGEHEANRLVSKITDYVI